MYVILVYDVNVNRVNKVLKVARRYLTWVQNSVLEGELTESKFKALQWNLNRVIDPREDSIIFYILGNQKYIRKVLLGIQKNEEQWMF